MYKRGGVGGVVQKEFIFQAVPYVVEYVTEKVSGTVFLWDLLLRHVI